MLQRILELLIIIDPLGAVPLYLAMAASFEKDKMIVIARQVGSALFIGSMIVTFGGAGVLSFFGVSLHVFNMIGGSILLLVGFNLMQLTPSKFKTEEPQFNSDVPWLLPITFPMLLGPASISALLSTELTLYNFANNVLAILIVSAITIVVLRGSLIMYHKLSKNTMHVIMSVTERCIGLIVCAMGLQMIINAGFSTVYMMGRM